MYTATLKRTDERKISIIEIFLFKRYNEAGEMPTAQKCYLRTR